MSRRSRGLLACSFAVCACSSTTKAFDAGGPDSVDSSTDTSLFSWSDAAYDVSPNAPDALAAPAIACVTDSDGAADGGAQCPLPPSLCANAQWLEYFDDGVCLDGGCQFQAKLLECGLACVDGGCINHASTLAPSQ